MKNKTDDQRYLVRMWRDYYNEDGKYKIFERSFSNKATAIKEAGDFVNNHENNAAVVIDLLKSSQRSGVLFHKTP